jgi:hypothetical protein
MKNILIAILADVLGCLCIAGLCVALVCWLSGSSMNGTIAWNTFVCLLLVFLGCSFLVGFPSLVEMIWEARPTVRAARAEEAERRAQSELKRVLLIEAERKARATRQTNILDGVVARFEAWTRQWEQEHPEDAQELAARRQARETLEAAQDGEEEEG